MCCSPQITEMAFLNSFPKGHIATAWPQIIHTKLKDKKGLIKDFEVWVKTEFILESRLQLELLSML